MANVKQVLIVGSLPYNANETPDLQPFLAQMVMPAFGLRISWGACTYIPNEFNGKTATYEFTIKGEEALRTNYFDYLKRAIDMAGGKVYSVFVKDIENEQMLIDKKYERTT